MEEILHQLIGSLFYHLQRFLHPRWCRISSINSCQRMISRIHDWNFHWFQPCQWREFSHFVSIGVCLTSKRIIICAPWCFCSQDSSDRSICANASYRLAVDFLFRVSWAWTAWESFPPPKWPGKYRCCHANLCWNFVSISAWKGGLVGLFMRGLVYSRKFNSSPLRNYNVYTFSKGKDCFPTIIFHE